MKVTLLLVPLLAGLGASASAPAAVAAGCAAGSGVTVVVQSAAGTSTQCAAGDPSSAWDALVATGHSVTPVQRFPGAICRIDGFPADDACVSMPPSDAYWALFTATAGGSWRYSSSGARAYDPAPGTAVGFRFGAGSPPTVAPPSPPAPPAPTSTQTASPPARPSTAAPPRATTGRSTADGAPSPGPASSPASGPLASSAPATATGPATPLSTPSGSSTLTTPTDSSTGTTSASRPGATESLAAAPTSARSSAANSPWPAILGGGLVVVLAGAAIGATRWRTRR